MERSREVEPGCYGSVGHENSSPATVTCVSARISKKTVGTEATDSITQFTLLAQRE